MSSKRQIIPDGLALRRYQLEGIKKLVTLRRSLLADEMGIGKSAQAIVTTAIWGCPSVVIVAPACLLENLFREWNKWDILRREPWIYVPLESYEYKEQPVVLCSYDNIRKLLDKDRRILLSLIRRSGPKKPIALIADEVTYLKNWNSKRGDAVLNSLVPLVHRTIFITGTPVTGKIESIHSIASTCAPNEFPPYAIFRSRYSKSRVDKKTGFIEYYGVRNVAELRAKLAPFMVRRFKKDVLKELPEKIYVEHRIEISESVAARSLDYIRQAEQMILNDKETGSADVTDSELDRTPLATARRELGIAKVGAVLELAEVLFEGGSQPLLVYAHHRAVCEQLYVGFKKTGYKVALCYGGMNRKKVQDAIDDFQSNQLQILVCSIGAMSLGITLTAGNHILFAEQSYKEEDMSQAEDRQHRISQTRGVVIHTVLAKNSLDIRVNQILRQKKKMTEAAVGAIKG